MKRTAETARFIFGCEMKACPTCGGFNLGYSTPIKFEGAMEWTAKGMLSAWAKAVKNGNTPLEGTCKLLCRDCGHKGPSVNVEGRSSEDVSRDPKVATEAKRLWNNQ